LRIAPPGQTADVNAVPDAEAILRIVGDELMLVVFLQVLTALHFVGLIGIIAMMQMDRFVHIQRNLAIALLMTFGSGAGLVVLLEQIRPFIWDDQGHFARKGSGGGGERDEDDDGEGGSGGSRSGKGGHSKNGNKQAGRPEAGGKGVVVDCEHCPEMVVIAGGKFALGAMPDEAGAKPSEKPQLPEVSVRSFALGRFEVSRQQYMNFSKATGHPLRASCSSATGKGADLTAQKPGFAVNSWQPMVCVSWTDAQKYAAWLGKVTGKTYRLPTAAEWEFAGRAGDTNPYQNGTRSISGNEARFGYNGNDAKADAGPVPVGSFVANARGLFDLHGNAAEWVEDCWAPSLKESPTNGKPVFVVSAQGCPRVVKGGGWHSPAEDVRLAARDGAPVSAASNGIGFRVARDLD
jgi:formylglycine-generating enzyme